MEFLKLKRMLVDGEMRFVPEGDYENPRFEPADLAYLAKHLKLKPAGSTVECKTRAPFIDNAWRDFSKGLGGSYRQECVIYYETVGVGERGEIVQFYVIDRPVGQPAPKPWKELPDVRVRVQFSGSASP